MVFLCGIMLFKPGAAYCSVWRVFGGCLGSVREGSGSVWGVVGECLGSARGVLGGVECLGGRWGVFGECLGSVREGLGSAWGWALVAETIFFMQDPCGLYADPMRGISGSRAPRAGECLGSVLQYYNFRLEKQ